MQTVTSRVNNNGECTISCPACRREKKTSVDGVAYGQHSLRVRCACTTIFKVQLDFRRHPRQPVNLKGRYETFHQHHPSKGAMRVTDISQGGLRCYVGGGNRLQTGYVLVLDFRLNDKRNNPVQSRAVVRSVRSNIIGCEFFDQDRNNSYLALYLRSLPCNYPV